jgi:hypothetical protein
MKKAVLGLLLVTLIFSMVSCDDTKVEATPEGVVSVEFSVAEPKVVTMKVNDEVAKYEYLAIPQFDLSYEDDIDTSVGSVAMDPKVDTQGVEGGTKDGIFGSQRWWKTLQVGENNRASLGYYRQGAWKFYLRTKNNNGQILTTGESEVVYLQKGKVNIVSIILKVDDSTGRKGENLNTGKIRFGFETNKMDEANISLNDCYIRLEANKLNTDGTLVTDPIDQYGKVTNSTTTKLSDAGFVLKDPGYTKVLANGSDSGWMVTEYNFGTVVEAGRVRFYAETPDLVTSTNEDGVVYSTGGIAAGQYLVRVKLCVKNEVSGKNEEIVIASQQIAIKVVGGETTTVVGTMVPERYVEGTLNVQIGPEVTGSIKYADDDSEDDVFEIVSGDSDGVVPAMNVKLKYVPDSNEFATTDLTYQWYVNGILQAGSNTQAFTFTPEKYGDAKITCVVWGYLKNEDNSDTTGTWMSKQASATQVIRIVPETGANLAQK